MRRGTMVTRQRWKKLHAQAIAFCFYICWQQRKGSLLYSIPHWTCYYLEEFTALQFDSEVCKFFIFFILRLKKVHFLLFGGFLNILENDLSNWHVLSYENPSQLQLILWLIQTHFVQMQPSQIPRIVERNGHIDYTSFLRLVRRAWSGCSTLCLCSCVLLQFTVSLCLPVFNSFISPFQRCEITIWTQLSSFWLWTHLSWFYFVLQVT